HGGKAAAVAPPPLGGLLEPAPVEAPAGPTDEGDGAGVQMRADHVIEFRGPASVVANLRRLIVACTAPEEPLWKGLVRLLAHVAREWRRTLRGADRIVRRDGYRCILPVCGARRNLQVHHLVFRSMGGTDDDENLGSLCSADHLRGVHGRRIRARGKAPHDIEWELGVGLRPGGEPWLRLHGPVYADPAAGSLEEPLAAIALAGTAAARATA
ncbi:MAG: HNH endonuclease, partial [Candidatus Binatia bacterium]